MRKAKHSIRILPVEIANVYRFAAGFADSHRRSETAPITLARARAQMNNPFATKNDTALFVAFEGDRCIGYHGQLPGLLATKEGVRPVLWGSTFFLLDEYRGKGIGRAFLEKVISLDRDFVATRITTRARKALVGFGLKSLGYLTYYQLRVERSHITQSLFDYGRKHFWKTAENRRAEKSLQLTEKIAMDFEKRLFYATIGGKIREMLQGYELGQADKITESDFFPGRSPSVPCFLRGPEIVNWMLAHKWIVSGVEKKSEIGNYHFSGARELFAYFPLKLRFRKTGEYRGFFVLCVSARKKKTSVRVLDHHLKTDDDIDAGCAAALLYARKYNADRVEFPREWGDRLGKSAIFRKFLKKQKREYLYYPKREKSPLQSCKDEIRLDYCDGDVAFT